LFVANLKAASPAVEAPRVFQFEPAALVRARSLAKANDASVSTAIAQIRADADKALNGGPYSVTQKKHPLPGGDPHDYVSLAPYFWPDPAKSDGIPYINRDGRRNPEIREYDATPFGDMSSHSNHLALGYYFTNDEKYADRAALILRTWFIDPATRMNPNLDHAQIIKGKDNGRPTGIIESLRLLPVIDAVGLLQGAKAWTADDQKGVESWFRDYQRWMLESKNGKGEGNAHNNHGCWYDVQVVTFALFLNDPTTARRVVEAARDRRIAPQIEPDGSMPLEIRRANSFHYSIYNVQALTALADLGRRVDVDLWHFQTADHRSIPAALDFLLPFATGRQKWSHPEIGTLSPSGLLIPVRRAASGLNDPKYETAAQTILKTDGSEKDSLLHPARASQ
jgi:hypothetical protein